MAFVSEKKNNRVIDYQRDAVLETKGNLPAENVTFFELTWKGQVIRFAGQYDTPAYDDQGKSDLDWGVGDLDIPPALQAEKEMVKTLIRDALHEYGFSFQKKDIKKIDVKFAIDAIHAREGLNHG